MPRSTNKHAELHTSDQRYPRDREQCSAAADLALPVHAPRSPRFRAVPCPRAWWRRALVVSAERHLVDLAFPVEPLLQSTGKQAAPTAVISSAACLVTPKSQPQPSRSSPLSSTAAASSESKLPFTALKSPPARIGKRPSTSYRRPLLEQRDLTVKEVCVKYSGSTRS